MLLLHVLAVLSLLSASTPVWGIHSARLKANEVLVHVEDYCSGIIFDKAQGLVATASHCSDLMAFAVTKKKEIRNGDFADIVTFVYKPVQLTINRYDDEGVSLGKVKYTAIFVGEDTVNDIAVLKITSDTSTLKDEAALSDKPVKFGDVVYAMGNPTRILSALSVGHVLHPRVPSLVDGIPITQISYDTFTNHGSSGGGLFNESGELVGVVDSVGKEFGDGYSAPVAALKALVSKLKLEKHEGAGR